MRNVGFLGGALIGLGYVLNQGMFKDSDTFASDEGTYMAEGKISDLNAKTGNNRYNLINWAQGQAIINTMSYEDFLKLLSLSSQMQTSQYNRHKYEVQHAFIGPDGELRTHYSEGQGVKHTPESVERAVEEEISHLEWAGGYDMEKEMPLWNADEGRKWTLGEVQGVKLQHTGDGKPRIGYSQVVVHKTGSRPVYHKGHGKHYKDHPTYFYYNEATDKVEEIDGVEDRASGYRHNHYPPNVQSHLIPVGIDTNPENLTTYNEVDDSWFEPIREQIRERIEGDLILWSDVEPYNGNRRLSDNDRNSLIQVIKALKMHIDYPKVKALTPVGRKGYHQEYKASAKVFPNPVDTNSEARAWVDSYLKQQREHQERLIDSWESRGQIESVKRGQEQLKNLNEDFAIQRYLLEATQRGRNVPAKAAAKKYATQIIVDDKGWLSHLTHLENLLTKENLLAQGGWKTGESVSEVLKRKQIELDGAKSQLAQVTSDKYWDDRLKQQLAQVKTTIKRDRETSETNAKARIATIEKEITACKSL